MKKIWKIRKDSEAVSPVIATILMVAITVVLAAVLYVMVMGFGGTDQQAPTGSFTAASKLSSTQEKIQFGVITPQIQPDDISIRILNVTASTADVLVWDGSNSWDKASPTTGIGSAVFVDLNADGNIASGDYLTITLSSALAGSYEVTMIYVPNGAAIDTITFNWA